MGILSSEYLNKVFRISLVFATMLAAAGCDKRKLEITDKSELKGISMAVSDTSVLWKKGTTRTFEIECDPSYARVKDYELKPSDAGIFTIIRNSERSFEVTASEEGAATITAIADGYISERKFSVYDDSIKKEDLDVKLHISTITDQTDMSIMELNTSLDAETRYHLTATSISNAVKYSLKTDNNDIISIEWDEDGSWVICTENPGRCNMVLTAAMDSGETFDYEYDIIVYGHISFTALFSVPDYIGGFKVDKYDHDISEADIYLNAVISGYPWNDKNDIIERIISPASGTYELFPGVEYPAIITAGNEAGEINSMYKMDGNEKVWYGVHAIQMDFLIKLNNPYIIIDDILDDSDREQPLYINFDIRASFQQEGLASFTDDNV